MSRSYKEMVDSIINHLKVDAGQEDEVDIMPDFIFMTYKVQKKLRKSYFKQESDNTSWKKHSTLTYINGIKVLVGTPEQCLEQARKAVVMGVISVLMVDEREVECDGEFNH